jgi:hypothetical protein
MVWSFLLAAVLAAPSARAAGSEMLADSTVVDGWRLPNGLEVVTRHIPGARAIASVLCYRTGSAQDPSGREGLTALLAELQFRGAATDVPERAREEIGILRPLGWNLKITPYLVHMAEIAAPRQFPGVLHQMAARSAGVTIDAALLKSAIANVKGDLAENYRGVERGLYYLTRDLSAGLAPGAIERYASGKGIEQITVKDAQQRLQATFTPANAVLSIAGDLTGYDLRRLVEREFGATPAGQRLPAPAPVPLKAVENKLAFGAARIPAAAIGVIGPALTDTLHPSFALHGMLLGSFCRLRWGPPPAPLTTRFDFAFLDDPELIRLYPPISTNPDDPVPVIEEYYYTLAELPIQIERSAYEEVLKNVNWLIGGPLPDPLLRRMQTEPGSLYSLASAMAARAQWGDADFWATYRRRFDEAAGRDLPQWGVLFGAKDRVIQLRLVPPKGDSAVR